ncbi:hypothetical protein [Muribaculum intestinale]|uniref:hypothetical protein n=1 Tax=Muribaculum intestinale TaxID=1796646 RepID=UPI0025A9BBBD|nr:hypothetical protein [Muribaculum intestinale]
MTKLNFQQFSIPLGIGRTDYKIGDARESVANMLYLNVNGIRAHALALKIYRSEGWGEYTEEETRTLREVAYTYGTPAFIDGLNEQINNQTKTD